MFIKVSALITIIIRFVFARARIFLRAQIKREEERRDFFLFFFEEFFFPVFERYVGGRSFGFEVNPPHHSRTDGPTMF